MRWCVDKVWHSLKCIESAGDAVGRYVSFLIIGMACILLWEVFLRGVFNSPTIWVHESTRYLFGAHFLAGGVYAMRHGAMVNVDILYTRFSIRARALIDLLTSSLFFIFIGVMLWKGFGLAVASVRLREASQTAWGAPVYPLKVMLVIGAALLLLQGLAKFIRDLHIAVGGKGSL
jgi:TRAP-type mannitol/chloroaromatic compound transport system permease small subunit